MQYREFSSKIKFKPSALGFGLMRLPMTSDGKVDINESVRIIRYAIDKGVNFLDTAYIYHGGESEKVLAKALKGGYRDKVKIADKMPMWMLKTESDLDRIFYDQLDRLQVKKIDFYLLHALSRSSITLIKKFNIVDWLEKKKSEGLIDYIGFSFHDKFPIFKKVMDLYDWDFCLIQFNLVDIKYQAGLKGVRYAHSRGVGVIVMEPLRGGQLTTSVPSDIMERWQNVGETLYDMYDVNPAEFLLGYVWDFPEVALLISGMSSYEQVKQNLRYATKSKVNSISKNEHLLYAEIRKAYLDKIVINCTSCNYCKTCPKKIAIPYIFDQINEVKRYENQKTPTFRYHFLTPEQKASNCSNCKKCKVVCPQKLDIPSLLDIAKQLFEENKKFQEIKF
jgi:hypothetical protein